MACRPKLHAKEVIKMTLLKINLRYWWGVALAYAHFFAPSPLKRFIGTAEHKRIDQLAAVATSAERERLLRAKGDGFTAVKSHLYQKYGIPED